MPLQRACIAGSRQETSCQMGRWGRSQMWFFTEYSATLEASV